jgi:hypothetical protein
MGQEFPMPHHDTLQAQDHPFDIDVGDEDDDDDQDEEEEDGDEEEEGGWQVGPIRGSRLDFARLKSL